MANKEFDSSIDDLLNDIQDETPNEINIDYFDTNSVNISSKSDLFSNKPGSSKTFHDVDLKKKEFSAITKFVNEESNGFYDDQNYYKIALGGEEGAQRVHTIFSKYLTCTDSNDRTVYRQNIVAAWWELIRKMAPKCANLQLPMPKRMLIRYAVLLPSLFRAEQKIFFSKMIYENPYNEPILYLDEWFKEIASGRLSNSMTDEKRTPHKALSPEEANQIEQSRLMQLQAKNSGKLQSAENILSIKENEREMLEEELKEKVNALCEHQPVYGEEEHSQPYTDAQQRLFAEISDRLHRLSKNNRELAKAFNDWEVAKASYSNVESKISSAPQEVQPADTEAVNIEFETVRQMAKMTCGRQGNQFPIFTREFYHCMEKGTGTRENVMEVLRWIESIDPGAFCRVHKNVPNRIVPYVLLLPTYGDRGFCWEPFDRYNRVTSRGRIVVPMYPRDLKIAVLTAVADLRWQVAKEKASYYWMEEGLTGQYYQYVDRMKLKGDIKYFFIEDYILWMTKESEGVQRLEKEVRGIFWRNMPFPKELKEDLRRRSLVYDELCIKDNNRAMSDGY